MSFEHSHTVTTTAAPEAVWRLWSDPGTWPSWDPSVVAVDLHGAFEEGTTGLMTLPGALEAPVLLAVVEPGRRYLDQRTLGDLVIRVDHVVEALADGGSEVVVSTTVDGPGADEVGPVLTAEAPLALAALTAAAEELSI